jgi:gliding motility-associated-like protein
MKHIKHVLIIFSIVIGLQTQAQITTSTLTIAQYVTNVLLGPGVTASGITYTGLPKMIASFTAPAVTNLGIPKGVYLTCGSNGTVGGELGPAGPSSGFQSIDQAQPGDAALTALSGITTNDAAVLEFNFIPQSDTVKFRYVFGSEEYNDYVNSINDAFAFILSGVTTPLAATNIALIPGTTTPITINTVNNGNSFGASTGPCMNCAFYRDNIGGSISCVYDGLTTVLTAKHKVICGETYHIKIAIADASDHVFDSGVFLEAGSFSSIPPISVSSSNSNASFTDSVMVEDCNTNCVYFIRNSNIFQKDSFKLQVTGNAILNSDYQQVGNPGFTWPSQLNYSVGQDTIKICNLKAMQDYIPEGTDTLVFTLTTYTTSVSTCALTNTIKFKLYIKDYTAISIGVKDTIICNGLSAILNANANFGVPAYTYTWTSPTTNASSINTGIITTPKNYTITVNDICNKLVSKVITITPSTLPVLTANINNKFCLDSILKIPLTITGGKPSFNISWGIPSSGIFPFDTINTTYYFTQSTLQSSGTYSIFVTDQCNNKDTLSIEISSIDCNLIIPNVISANGDNINDYFKISGLLNFPGSTLLVFNRWGNKIYTSDDYKNDWKPNVSSGTYFYILNVTDGRKLNGFIEVFKD